MARQFRARPFVEGEAPYDMLVGLKGEPYTITKKITNDHFLKIVVGFDHAPPQLIEDEDTLRAIWDQFQAGGSYEIGFVTDTPGEMH